MTSGSTTGFWTKWSELQGGSDQSEPAHALETTAAWRRFFGEFFGTTPENHWLFGGRRYRAWFSAPLEVSGQYNPIVGATMSKGAGLLSLYVLHLIAETPRYGNDIMRQIEQQTQGRWAANPGAIYPLLDALEESGLLTGVWEDERKRTRRVYALTAAGREELQRVNDVIRPLLYEAIEILSAIYAETGPRVADAENEHRAFECA